jgi:hypothetical protein
VAVWREGDAAVAAVACAGISRELEALRSREIADGSERRARAIAVAAWRIAECTPAAALDALKILRSLAGDQFEIADDAALDERRRQRVRAKMLMKELLCMHVLTTASPLLLPTPNRCAPRC